MPNYQARIPQVGTPKRLPQTTGQPPQNDFRVGEIRGAPLIGIALSDVMDADRLLNDGEEIGFVDGGPKGTLSFTLKTTGIAPATYGAALKIPVITFDSKGRATLASEVSLGTAAALNSDNDPTLAANSNSRLATQAAVKGFVENAVAGLLDFKGNIDCSADPNYPAASKGDAYLVSIAGKIGGASGSPVDVGDVIVASADNAGGTQAAVSASWFILEHNLQGALQSTNNLGDVPSPATARTNLGLAIGSDVQGYDADLAAIAALTTTAFGRTFLTIADQAAARAHIGAFAASDYATGTWTSSVLAGDGSITSATANGRYTKIGNVIVASVEVIITTNGTGAAFIIVDLPFANNASMGMTGAGRDVSTGIQLQASVDPSGTSMIILNYNNTYPGADGRTLRVTMTYTI